MKKIVILFLFFICLSLFSCEQRKNEGTTKVILTLFDLSESTARPDIRAAYVKAFKRIIEVLKEGDSLLGACITERSIQQIDLPVEFEHPIFRPSTDNPLLRSGERDEFEKRISSMKEERIKRVDELVIGKEGQPKILKTDIMSSVMLAANILKRYPERRRILVIFSDMIEDSESYNFERLKLTDKKIKEIIEKEKNRGMIPELNGVRVYITGAQARTLEMYNSIKKFWTEYFRVTGAELVEYSSTFLGLRE